MHYTFDSFWESIKKKGLAVTMDLYVHVTEAEKFDEFEKFEKLVV